MKYNAEETILVSLHKNKKHCKEFISPTPKHIGMKMSGNVFTFSIDLDMSKELKINQKIHDFIVRVTDDPTTINAKTCVSIGYHAFTFNTANSVVVNNNPLVLLSKRRDLCTSKEYWNIRNNNVDDMKFPRVCDFENYKNTLTGDYIRSDYYFQPNHCNRIIKLHSRFINSTCTGDVIIFSLNPDSGLAEKGILFMINITSEEELIKIHAQLMNVISSNFEQIVKSNNVEIDINGTPSTTN